MKIKMTDRCVTFADLQAFVQKLEDQGVSSDQILNPDSKPLLSKSETDKVTDLMEKAVRPYVGIGKALEDAGIKTGKVTVPSGERGVVIWVELEI